MNIYIMAKTIMVADKVYNELKKAKGKDKSFTEVIVEALEAVKSRRKTGEGLREVAGILEGDTEYGEVMKMSKKMWKEWDKRLDKELRRE